jgi:uncharacterized membrane protein
MKHLRPTALVALMLTPSVGWAGLEFCNETSVKQTVAIGYKDGEDWVSEGWWNIDSGDCATPINDDLKSRYYYYRALVSGREFQDENIAFCTAGKAFTIVGDSDCVSRGYEESMFSKIDTGKTAKHFTFTITDAGFPAPTPEPTPTPAPAPDPVPESTSAEPERYGEPYASAAILQECLSSGGQTTCSFHADGTKLFVQDDGRTPSHIFGVLQSLEVGEPITIAGDLVAFYDHTADVVLREVTTRSWSGADILLDKMQGQWYAKDDPDAQFTILGSERENTYSGAITGIDYLSVQEWCAGFEGDGSYLYAREEGSGDSFCYAIENVDDSSMTLTFLPRGNMLEYLRLD